MSHQIVQTMTVRRQLVAPRIQVARPPRPRRIRRRLRAMLAPFLLFITLLAQISVRVQLVERGYELEQLRSAALGKDTELRQLKLDLALATLPTDLTRSAESRVGLRPVDPQKVRAMITKDEEEE